MSRRHKIDHSQHHQTRSVLRIIGPTIFLVGLILTIIGIAGFFSSFNSAWDSGPSFGSGFESMPGFDSGSGFGHTQRDSGMSRFFLAFIGLPMMGVGAAISKFAFLGSVARYVASEAAPVVKDTTNYMIDGTKGAVSDLAQSVGAGIAAGMAGDQSTIETTDCPGCGEACDSGARFCDQCGTPIPGDVSCNACGEMNDPNAKFCNQCGQSTV